MCWICQALGKPRNHRRIAHRRKLRESGIGVPVTGSRGWLRRARPRGPCPGGDCVCDMHEGVTDHRMSRAVSKAQARWDIDQGTR